MYKLIQHEGSYSIQRLSDGAFIPKAEGNRDYQQCLQDIIDQGASIVEGADVIAPDYVALRTGPDGYASTGDQLGMIAEGTQAAHVADVKTRFPKSNTGSTTIGDVPQDILDAAADKLAAKQLRDYTAAIARLAQYIVSVGRVEVTEMQATGEQVYNEETFEMDDVMASVVTVSAIDPVDATVEQTTYDDEGVSTTVTIENPLITTDVAERAAAQAVVDATPAAVIPE